MRNWIAPKGVNNNVIGPGARPTNDISIEFEIRSELGAL